jgi:hypothetical protein
MRSCVFALTILLAALATASAEPATPDSENGRYSFNPVADGVLRLDTRTGQVSQCSRSDAGWTCREVPDERSSLESEIARLQGENAMLKKELLAKSAGGKAQRAGAQAAERCRGRQGDVVPREGLAPAGRDGERGAEGCREEKLRGCYLDDDSIDERCSVFSSHCPSGSLATTYVLFLARGVAPLGEGFNGRSGATVVPGWFLAADRLDGGPLPRKASQDRNKLTGTAGWTRTTDLLVHSQAL